MELMWESLLSDFPGNEEGHGGFFVGHHKNLFATDGRIVYIHKTTFLDAESNTKRLHILFDAFDPVSGERERAIFTSPDFEYNKNKLSWDLRDCHIADGRLNAYLYPYISHHTRMMEAKAAAVNPDARLYVYLAGNAESNPAPAILQRPDTEIIHLGNMVPDSEKDVTYKHLAFSDGKIIARDLTGKAPPKEYCEDKTYTFGDYQVFEINSYTTACRRISTNEVIWKKRHGTSWLYTPVEEKGGVIFFGTSGNGGHFYALSLATGETLCDVNNGGCEHYA